MSPNTNSPGKGDLRGKLAELNTMTEDAAASLVESSRALRTNGTPPSTTLEARLTDLRVAWGDLQIDLFEAGVAGQDVDATLSLGGIRECLDRWQHTAKALRIVDQLAAIRPVDGTQLPELSVVHRQADDLRDQLKTAEGVSLARELNDGQHPSTALLRLLREGENLPDDEWLELQDCVEKSYGSLLATATARGKLILTPVAVGDEFASDDDGNASDGIDDDPHAALPSGDADTAITPQSLKPAMPRSPVIHFTPHAEPPVEVLTPAPKEALTEQPPVVPARPSAFSEVAAPVVVDDSPGATDAPSEVVNRDSDSNNADQDDGSIFDEVVTHEQASGPALLNDRSLDLHDLAGVEALEGSAVIGLVQTAAGAKQAGDVVPLEKNYRQEHGSVYEAAQRARTASEVERDDRLSTLILELSCQGRLGLAQHLAASLEAEGDVRAPFLPAWLLHALALAPGVSFAKGRIAALLEEDFAECHGRDCIGLKGDWAEAAGYLVRAATLRPAVVAPATRAASILRSFPLNEECTELYNFCARIGAAGERLQGLMPALFKHDQTDVTKADRLTALQSEALHWRELLEEQSVRYSPAEQLFLHAHWSVRAGTSMRYADETRMWQKWQQTLRLANSVIAPVLADDSSAQSEVRAEIARLDKIVRVGTPEDQAATPGGSGLIFLPSVAMHDVIREAMSFGQQWLNLHTSSATESEFFLPQAAEELRADVLSRHESVIAELVSVRDRSHSLPIRTGIECLIRSIRQLKEMVDPQSVVDSNESPPRHLLHAELLKLPSLSLNEAWEPMIEAPALTRSLLRYLTEPQPDWRTAFQLCCEAGDRTGTDRLLELSVWKTVEDRRYLRRLRDQYVAPTRESLLAEVAAFERDLSRIVDDEARSDVNRRVVQNRIRDIRDSLQAESPANLVSCRAELMDLWSGVIAASRSTEHHRLAESDHSSAGISSAESSSSEARSSERSSTEPPPSPTDHALDIFD